MVDIEIIADPSISDEQEQALTMAAGLGVRMARRELTISKKWDLTNQKLVVTIEDHPSNTYEDPFVIAAYPANYLIHVTALSPHGWPHDRLTEASAKAVFLAQRASSCPPECTPKGLETVGEAMVREALLKAFIKQMCHLFDIKYKSENNVQKLPIFLPEPDRTIWSQTADQVLSAPHHRLTNWLYNDNKVLHDHYIGGFCNGEKAVLPKISGLNLGFLFINRYLEVNDLKASEGVDLPPKTVFSAWKRGEWREIVPN